MFSAHSTRGAAASKAVAAGISVDTVLRAGHWASASTFRKFYHREVPADPSLVEIVLQPDGISSRSGYLICSCSYQFACVYLYACTEENCVWLIDTDVRSGVVVSLCGYLFFFSCFKDHSSNGLVNRYEQFTIVPVFARTIRILRYYTIRFEL